MANKPQIGALAGHTLFDSSRLMLGESKYQSPPIYVPICTYHVQIVLDTSKPRNFVGFVMEDKVCVSYYKSSTSHFAATNF